MARLWPPLSAYTRPRGKKSPLRSPVPPAEQRAAYRSGDPAKIAAAGVTAADTDYIAAPAALAGID
jgi:hypothetical protein